MASDKANEEEVDASALVPASEEAAESPTWELRMLLERAAELERLQRYEEALVLYHRGRKRAPLVPDFQRGVERAERALATAIGADAAGLFADIPGLLPGMIEAQRTARTQRRRAARAAHERLKEAVQNMTFAESGAGGRRDAGGSGEDEDDVVVGGSRQLAVRGDERLARPRRPRCSSPH